MKTFAEVAKEQKIPTWLKGILKELLYKGYALETNYDFKEISIFGSSLPEAEGYDELEKHVKDLQLSISSVNHIWHIEGNPVIATINYTDDTMKGNSSEEAKIFNDFVSNHARYYRTLGNDGNHPTDWVK